MHTGHDCGPASKGNFTTFDDDGWWDDDENYWDDDYDCFWPCGITFDGAFLHAIERPDSLVNFHTGENYDSADDDAPHVAFIKSTPNPKSRANLDDVKGVGGVFMMLLEVRSSA